MAVFVVYGKAAWGDPLAGIVYRDYGWRVFLSLEVLIVLIEFFVIALLFKCRARVALGISIAANAASVVISLPFRAFSFEVLALGIAVEVAIVVWCLKTPRILHVAVLLTVTNIFTALWGMQFAKQTIEPFYFDLDCRRNLKAVGHSIQEYARHHGGVLPTAGDVVALRFQITPYNKKGNGIFRCVHPRQRIFLADTIDRCYTWNTEIAGKEVNLSDPESSRLMLVWDSQRHHGNGAGVNALFLDGHVAFVRCAR